MNIIFLDIDGVLNDSKTTELCGFYKGISTKLLKNLFSLVSKTNSKIVLVSTWKKKWYKEPELKNKQDDFANYLDERFAEMNMCVYDKLIGHTFDRGVGIKMYVAALEDAGEEVNFIILDDELFDYREEHLMGSLIKTNYHEGGLNELKTNIAIDVMLNKQIHRLK